MGCDGASGIAHVWSSLTGRNGLSEKKALEKAWDVVAQIYFLL